MKFSFPPREKLRKPAFLIGPLIAFADISNTTTQEHTGQDSRDEMFDLRHSLEFLMRGSTAAHETNA